MLVLHLEQWMAVTVVLLAHAGLVSLIRLLLYLKRVSAGRKVIDRYYGFVDKDRSGDYAWN